MNKPGFWCSGGFGGDVDLCVDGGPGVVCGR